MSDRCYKESQVEGLERVNFTFSTERLRAVPSKSDAWKEMLGQTSMVQLCYQKAGT